MNSYKAKATAVDKAQNIEQSPYLNEISEVNDNRIADDSDIDTNPSNDTNVNITKCIFLTSSPSCFGYLAASV